MVGQDQHHRKSRNWFLLSGLVGFYAIFYILTMIKIKFSG